MPLPSNGPLPEFVSLHFEESSFLWSLRRGAIHAPHYTFVELERLDERIEAHLDGLRVAGEAARAIVDEALPVAGMGEIFTSAVSALDTGPRARFPPVLELARESEPGLEALLAALSWLPWPRVAGVIEQLSKEEEPALLRVALSGYAAHRQDAGAALSRALASTDVQLRARALQVVGEQGRRELLPLASQSLASADEGCRFSAARTCVLLGERAALPVLRSLAEQGGPHAMDSCELAVRRMTHRDARAWLMGFTERPEHRRLAFLGSAALGDPFLIPWLLHVMRVPEFARVAGESFRFITGADLSEPRFEGKAPEGIEAEDDPDEEPPWPAPEAVESWWAERKRDFHPEARHLLGRPMTPEALRGALQFGRQRERKAAALELALRHPGQPLLDVGASAFRQRQWLAALM
ncbi:TIGR02270 family protein [Archangium violaceum]|uniref:TIGR02270 family protein n=1 Tax=Archangium violaceum TaxID=83451 RepID=UPI00193AEF93|nr:TIGR02270 family protein [Archangium violaceum]QRK06339.1 TIGR02270 family protein [Archangium violaceum]